MSPPARVTVHAAESNCQRSFLGRTHTRPHPDTGLLAHLRLDLLASHLARRLGRLGGHALRGAAILVVTASTTWLARALVFPVLLLPPLQVGAIFTLADVAFLLATLGDGLRSAGRWKHGVARFDLVITCVFHRGGLLATGAAFVVNVAGALRQRIIEVDIVAVHDLLGGLVGGVGGLGVHRGLLFLHALASDTAPFLTRQGIGRIAV